MQIASKKKFSTLKKPFSLHLIAFLIYGVLCGTLFFSLLRQPTKMISDDYDGLFIAWTINWVQHTLLHISRPGTFFQLYNAPLFSPLPLSYTFSDPFLTAAVIALPFRFFTNEPLFAVTINTLLAVFLTSFFSYLFSWKVTKRWGVSFVVGLWIGLGVTHLHYLGHLHVLMIQWIPLGLLTWWKFITTQRKHFVFLFAGSFLLQILNSPFSGYLFLLCLLPVLFLSQSRSVVQKNWRVVVATCLFAMVITVGFYLPFFLSGNLYHSFRTLNDAAHFALSLEELVSLQRFSRLYFLIWPSVFFALYRLIKNGRKGIPLQEELQRNFLLAGIATLILALGPVLKWGGHTIKLPFPIPLPYAVTYYLLPGFKAFRTPSRWLMATHICVGFFLALSISKKRGSLLMNGVLILLTCFIYLEAITFARFTAVSATHEYPSVYKALSTLPAGNVLHLPSYTYDMKDGKQEVYRMLFSLEDSGFIHPSYNGYSGYAPQKRMDEMNWMNQTPFSSVTQKIIHENAIQYVVIHEKEFSPENIQLNNELKKSAISAEGDDYIVVSTHFSLACEAR